MQARVAAAFTALRARLDDSALRAALGRGEAAVLAVVPWDAVLAARLLGDAMRTFRDVYEAAGDAAAVSAKRQVVGKAYDPNQPRAPAGSPDGGQWTSDGGGGIGSGASVGGEGGGGPTTLSRPLDPSEQAELTRFETPADELAQWLTEAVTNKQVGQQDVGKADDYEARVDDFAFDVLNDRGLRFLQQHAARRVVEITDATREALRVLLAEMHAQGVPVGQQVARIKQTVGLTTQQVRTVEALRSRLDEDGVAPARVERLVERKVQDLRRQRALLIARTETAFAASAGQRESWRQMVDGGLFAAEEASRVWMTAEDEATCPICEPLDGQERGLDEAFVTEDGEPIEEPPAHPACRCDVVLRISEQQAAA